jgi:hypothetical protein
MTSCNPVGRPRKNKKHDLMPITRDTGARSPRKIFVTEHERVAPGSRSTPLLYINVTKAKLSKHVSGGARARYIAHLKKEFEKGLELIVKEPVRVPRGSIETFMISSQASSQGGSSSTTALPSSLAVKLSDTAKKAKRKLALEGMPDVFVGEQ